MYSKAGICDLLHMLPSAVGGLILDVQTTAELQNYSLLEPDIAKLCKHFLTAEYGERLYSNILHFMLYNSLP